MFLEFLFIYFYLTETSAYFKLRCQKPWFYKNQLLVTSEEIHASAQRAGYNVQAIKLPVQIKITSVFDEGSEEGAAILDFLSDVYRFRESVPDDMKSDFMKSLGSPDISSKMNDGSVLLDNNQEILIVQRGAS